MRQHKGNIVDVITSAYEAGLNVPKYYFQKHYEEMKDTFEEHELIVVPPLYFVKPEGVEFNYSIFWTGRKFRGGFVTIKNNYRGLGRGPYNPGNGKTMFAAHVPEFKKSIKKIVGEEPVWVSIDGVLSEGKIYFWGFSEVDSELVEKLTGDSIDVLTQKFTEDETTNKPEGFVAASNIFGPEGFSFSEGPEKSITKAWKEFYIKASMLKKEYWYTENMDTLMRKGYSELMKAGKL
jgi:hypothetical protein